MTPDPQGESLVLHEIRAMHRDLRKFMDLTSGIVLKRESVKQQAKRLGVHPCTVRRRQVRAKMQQDLENA